jgi:serine phosphatase RsbU (regulator of sigma subunit)
MNSKILVVDDNKNNREILSRFLNRQNFQVITAENGSQALDLMQTEPIDLVLLDIMMPEINGYQVLEIMQKDPYFRYIPVIVVSAIDELKSVARCIEMGADDYLFKPINRVLLEARVKSSLEKKRLRDQEQEYLEVIKRELQLAGQIQADFLPVKLPEIVGWEIATYLETAQEVGGDFYDIFQVSQTELVVLISDVCDKGVVAALYMALTRTILRVLTEQIFGDKNLIPLDNAAKILQVIKQANAYLVTQHGQSDMFATLFFAVVNLTTGEIHYLNAGHEPPFYLQNNRIIAKLEPTGPIIGMIANAHYTVNHLQMSPGSVLFAYTDGAIEVQSTVNGMFSGERLKLLLEQYSDQTLTNLVDTIKTELHAHVAKATYIDDITLVALRYLAEQNLSA